MWVLIGATTVVRPVTPGAELIHERVPVPLRVALWATTGLIAMTFAWLRRPGVDAWGYAALVVMPIERAASFSYGFLLYIIPGLPLGYAPGIVGALTWGSVVIVLLIISGWAEPELRDPDLSKRRSVKERDARLNQLEQQAEHRSDIT